MFDLFKRIKNEGFVCGFGYKPSKKIYEELPFEKMSGELLQFMNKQILRDDFDWIRWKFDRRPTDAYCLSNQPSAYPCVVQWVAGVWGFVYLNDFHWEDFNRKQDAVDFAQNICKRAYL